LVDKDPATHLAVIYSLGKIGPAAASSMPELKRLAAGDDPLTAVIASWASVCLDPDNIQVRREAIGRVVRALRSEDRKIRQTAARALVDLPKSQDGDPTVRKEFEKLLAESSPETIADSLEAIAETGPRAVPGLIVALKHKGVRAAVANVLGQIGPEAKQAVPALTEALADSDAAGRREILFALGRIGAEDASAVAAIIQAMEDEEENVRYSAVYALGKIGAPAAAGTEALKKNLVSEDAFFRMCSAWALAMVNPQGEDIAKLTVPLLVEALKHERAFARIEAADALGRLGKNALSAAPALQAALKDPDDGVREAAATALKQISN
jgi:HEAT repeat protein